MSKKMELIPELRFPEFEKEEEWELTTIGDIGNFYYGKSAPKWSLSEDAPTLCVRYGELYTKFDTVISDVKSRTNIEPSNLKFSKGGEILVPRVGERPSDFAKNCCYLPFPNIAIGEMISVFETKEFPIFYTYYFRTLWREFAEVVEGQNVKNLYYVNLEPIKIGKTSYPEQQKIASCLSSLDELIAAHNDKLEALKDHKKGLMQNLFPQKGDRMPKVRFKEFEKDGEWEIRSIKKNIDLISGIALKGNELLEDSSGSPILRGINITEGLIRHSDKIDRFYLGDTSEMDKYLVKEKDIVIGMDGSKVGKNVALISERDSGSILIQRVARVRAVNSDVEYLYQHFLSYGFRNYVDMVNTSSGIPHISAKQIKDYEVGFPPKIKEQQKIASCLSALDELIMAQTEIIEQLQEHKVGLMQGLFPKIQS